MMFAYIKNPSSSCSYTSPPFLHPSPSLSQRKHPLQVAPSLWDTKWENVLANGERWKGRSFHQPGTTLGLLEFPFGRDCISSTGSFQAVKLWTIWKLYSKWLQTTSLHCNLKWAFSRVYVFSMMSKLRGTYSSGLFKLARPCKAVIL